MSKGKTIAEKRLLLLPVAGRFVREADTGTRARIPHHAAAQRLVLSPIFIL